MFKFFRVLFRLFVSWNVHKVVFLPIFFFVIFVLLKVVFPVLSLVAIISLPPPHFFMSSSSCCIYGSTLYLMLASSRPPSYLDTHRLSTPSHECKALCIVGHFLFSDQFVDVLLSSTLRMILSVLRGGRSIYLSLWWDSYNVFWFGVVFRFS